MTVKADNGKKITTGNYKIIIVNKNVVIPKVIGGAQLPKLPPGIPLTKSQAALLVPTIPSTAAQMIKGLPPGIPSVNVNIPVITGTNLDYSIVAGTVENLLTPFNNLDDMKIAMIEVKTDAQKVMSFLKFENNYRKAIVEPKLSDIGSYQTSIEFKIKYIGNWQKKKLTITVTDPNPPKNLSSIKSIENKLIEEGKRIRL